ncbi:MAG: M15 family metallopeptidase [Aquiluna sp.]|nr:M15 family metallopeptidase [Aquiluna sp.]
MPKSNSLRRNPLFVFGPPVALVSLGFSLIFQPNSFGSQQHEIILDRIEQRAESGWEVPELEFTDYLYPRLAMDQPSHPWVLLNKSRPLNPIDYAPTDLRTMESSSALDNSRELRLANDAATALEEMADALKDAGAGQLFVNSAYRTYEYQGELFLQKVAQYGEAEALLRSAKAGYSEHQTGFAVDVSVPAQGCAIMQCFGDTVAGIWIEENSWRFGYIVRYERDTSEITGFTYEPWHLRYIGSSLAKIYHESGMDTLEEFWGLPAAPSYPAEITPSTSD